MDLFGDEGEELFAREAFQAEDDKADRKAWKKKMKEEKQEKERAYKERMLKSREQILEGIQQMQKMRKEMDPYYVEEVYPVLSLREICMETVSLIITGHHKVRNPEQYHILPRDIKDPMFAYLTRRSKITDESFALYGPRDLDEVNLRDGCLLTGASLEVLHRTCPSLTSLDLTNCWGIEENAISTAVESFSNLRRLCLNGITVVPSLLISIFRTTKTIETLSLSSCYWMTPEDRQKSKNFTERWYSYYDSPHYTFDSKSKDSKRLHKRLENLPTSPSITSLTLTNSEAPLFLAKTVSKIVSACPELTSLDISDLYLDGYGDEPVPLKDMKHPLRLMHLANYRALTDGAFIAAINKHSPALTSLCIRGCTWIQETGLMTIASCKELRVLDMERVPTVTDASLRHIGRGCPLLEELNLSTVHISVKAFSNHELLRYITRAANSHRKKGGGEDAKGEADSESGNDDDGVVFPNLRMLDIRHHSYLSAWHLFQKNPDVKDFAALPDYHSTIISVVEKGYLPSLQALRVSWPADVLRMMEPRFPSIRPLLC